MPACAHPAYIALPDDSLLPAVLRRDPRAFAELVRRYRGLLYRCITRITARYRRVLASEDQDEIFAEVCVALWSDDLRRLRAFDPARGMKLGSWIGLITSHATYDFLRRLARRPRQETLENVPEPTSNGRDALDDLLCDERRAQLGLLTAELSERDQAFFAVYFGADRDPEEVARALGISVKTVYSKKNKITTRLIDRAAELGGCCSNPPSRGRSDGSESGARGGSSAAILEVSRAAQRRGRTLAANGGASAAGGLLQQPPSAGRVSSAEADDAEPAWRRAPRCELGDLR